MTAIDFTPTPFLYILTGFVIGMTLGWVIGFFDSNSRSAKKIEIAESKADQSLRESEKKIAQAKQQIELASQITQSAEHKPSLLRLKNEDGRFGLEMDGASVSGALSPDKRKRLIELVTVLRPWIEGGQPTQAVSQPVSQPSTPVQPPPVPAPVQSAVSYPYPAPPIAPAAKKPEAEKSITSMSIVNQIDSVLQDRLVNTPLAKRGVRLQESIEGGVEVYVGLEKFSTVDDVSDDVIKTAIRAAIAEWEKKYTPGL